METHSPTVVIFGATGHLALSKLFPALGSLLLEGFLDPDTHIIAVGRRPWTTEAFAVYVREYGDSIPEELFSHITYTEIDFEHRRGYDQLKKELSDSQNILCYLSVAPRLFTPIIEDLRNAHMFEHAGAKLLLEKPLGTDRKSAKALEQLLLSFLSPEQIYLVDHYLGKTTLQALMRIHETDPSLRALISNKTVSTVTIAIEETSGIGTRGASYDHVGALRDVGQNHLLEMLAVLMAEYPQDKANASWQNARALVLEQLQPPEASDIRRGQYEGYLKKPGVTEHSSTETAFEIHTTFKSGELASVPVILRAGKMLPESRAYMELHFHDGPDLPRKILFEIQPQPRIIYTEHSGERVVELPSEHDAYANVFLDALRDERRHFVDIREVLAAWTFTDKILAQFTDIPLEKYSAKKPFLTE